MRERLRKIERKIAKISEDQRLHPINFRPERGKKGVAPGFTLYPPQNRTLVLGARVLGLGVRVDYRVPG